MGKLDGKVALITGGSKGIGKGIARGLAEEGAITVLAAREVEALNRTADEIRGNGTIALPVPTDVTDEAQVERLFERTMQRFNRLDILFNNAGVVEVAPIDELSAEVWDRTMSVNLRGPFLCTRAAMRIMKKQRSGRIINIGSVFAQRVSENSGAYSTSKFGIRGLTQVTALEGRPHGIAVSCLHPGSTLVERVQDRAEPYTDPIMDVDDVVPVAVLMATQPPEVNMLEAIVMPMKQLYIGRG